jgi:hypothetical protein
MFPPDKDRRMLKRLAFALTILIAPLAWSDAYAMQDQFHDNSYPAEEAAARALTRSGRFAISCAHDIATYRFGGTFSRGGTFGPCGPETLNPTLVRVHSFPNGGRLFLVEGNGIGMANSGTLLYHDGSRAGRLRRIDIDNFWYFAQVRAVDRVVMHDGNVTRSNRCGGLLSWMRELVLDWTRERIRQQRLIRRDPC